MGCGLQNKNEYSLQNVPLYIGGSSLALTYNCDLG